MDKLTKYRSKRNPKITTEPFSTDVKDKKNFFFVVQKHKATSLHYDFRLEAGGIMLSWAVPKGPSLDHSVKRLAMQTEDHPLDYRHFEGVIPEGEYGGGPVIIWDYGIYYPEQEIEKGKRLELKDKEVGEKVLEKGLKSGEIKFFLNGKKLKGSFALIKTSGFIGKNAWLLIKHKDEFSVSGFDAKDYSRSEKSGKTIEKIK